MSRHSHILRYWRLGLQCVNFGGDTIQPITEKKETASLTSGSWSVVGETDKPSAESMIHDAGVGEGQGGDLGWLQGL